MRWLQAQHQKARKEVDLSLLELRETILNMRWLQAQHQKARKEADLSSQVGSQRVLLRQLQSYGAQLP